MESFIAKFAYDNSAVQPRKLEGKAKKFVRKLDDAFLKEESCL
jgi:hypothetical protein